MYYILCSRDLRGNEVEFLFQQFSEIICASSIGLFLCNHVHLWNEKLPMSGKLSPATTTRVSKNDEDGDVVALYVVADKGDSGNELVN